MATNSTRNLSYEEAQKMWPGVDFAKDEVMTFTVESKDNSFSVDKPSQASDIRNSGYSTSTEEYVTRASKMLIEAVKADTDKPDWSLVPFEALEGMVRVLEHGAEKYSRNNWQTNGGFKWTRLVSSTLRHLFAWARGQDLDPDSGLNHIYHCQCNLLFLSMYVGDTIKFNKDDRGT